MLKNKMQEHQTLQGAAVNEDEKKGTVAVFEGEVIPHEKLIYGVKPYPALQTKRGKQRHDARFCSLHKLSTDALTVLNCSNSSRSVKSRKLNECEQDKYLQKKKKTLSFHTQPGWDAAQP